MKCIHDCTIPVLNLGYIKYWHFVLKFHLHAGELTIPLIPQTFQDNDNDNQTNRSICVY